MDKIKSHKTTESFRLIKKADSKNILKAIINGSALDTKKIPPFINIEKIENLRQLYKAKLSEIGNKNFSPRNLPFYLILKDLYKNDVAKNDLFQTDTEGNITGINPLRRHGQMVSLLSMLLAECEYDNNIALYKKYQCIDKLPIHYVKGLDKLLAEISALYPNEAQMQHIVDCIIQGLNGKPIALFSMACPDYSVKKSLDKSVPYIHTFNSLGKGIGIIARRLHDSLPKIYSALTALSIPTTIIVAFPNFEALSDSTLKRLKISRQEFLNRLSESKKAFQASFPYPAKIIMTIDDLIDEKQWIAYHKHFSHLLLNNNFFKFNLTEKDIDLILQARLKLYERWYGKKLSKEESLPILFYQAAEYAALGKILQRFENCLIVGADHSVMAPFYDIEKIYPKLYLKRFYT